MKKSFLAPPRWAKGCFWPWLLRRVLTMGILFISLMIIGGFAFKDRLIFHPLAGLDADPKLYGLSYEEKWLSLPGGQQVKAWRLDPDGPDRNLTLILLQGNSGNMSLMLDRLSILSRLGLSCLTVDYPGYGDSPGRPDEELVYQTAEALYAWAKEKGARPERTIIYGFSLGGGVASHLAEKRPSAALILDSTFTKLRDVPGHDLPLLKPYFKLILGEAFDTQSRLERIGCPLLVLHSPEDDVVPFALGQSLYERYANNEKLMAVGRGDHMSFLLNQKLYIENIKRLIEMIDPAAASEEDLSDGAGVAPDAHGRFPAAVAPHPLIGMFPYIFPQPLIEPAGRA